MSSTYPKRLIEVDLPIARISAHARREKSIRHGHISTLHIWWARRPLAACRAVICASLWPDPADPLCPQAFRDEVVKQITAFAKRVFPEKITDEKKKLQETASPESLARWETIATAESALDPTDEDHQNILRFALLDFIADFANWDNSTVPAYLESSRALTHAAHEALGGAPGTKPLVVDPFAGGGSIPLEALRVGADAFGSDYNPVAVLLNKVTLEYIPKFGLKLAELVRECGKNVERTAQQRLAMFYPASNPDKPPVAYLWARTIVCEGPNCGTRIPLIRSLWVSKQGKRSVALRLVPLPEERRIEVEVITDAKARHVANGTVQRGSVTCPCCKYTTPVKRVREQLLDQEGGSDTSQMLVVVSRNADEKAYRKPTSHDIDAVVKAAATVDRAALVPPIELPLMSGVFNAPIYGITRWDLLFSSRQLLAASILGDEIAITASELDTSGNDRELALAVKVLLLLARGKYLDFRSTLCGWISVGEKIGHTFGRQALGMIFDWTEGTPFGDISGSWPRCIESIAEYVEQESRNGASIGSSQRASAQSHPLPDDSVSALITDPPYYNAVPYADLSDYFQIWLHRSLANDYPTAFGNPTVEKADELCEMKGWDPVRYPDKDAQFYEVGMEKALAEGRRLCIPSGIGVIVFAHKSTTGWETLISAIINAGWIVTGSWPIDTERGGRLRAMNSAALASSVHLVCRPREDQDGKLVESVGEWRDILSELPKRIHEWMPRLASEGVVGADAIFACLGPALEIFSRYSRVEKSNGEAVTLKEYLEHVWGAVSTEALSMIFRDADAAGLEPDARMTAMWLWTLGGGKATGSASKTKPEDNEDDAGDEESDDDAPASKGKGPAGFVLEFDAARKIAQGLGIHLEKSESFVEVKGDKARLLPVAERTRYLFGKADQNATVPGKRKKKSLKQGSLFEELDAIEEESSAPGTVSTPTPGATVLDRVHQAMILFAGGRGEALRRFLVDDNAGKDSRFWKLAQSLSALYPTGTDEKRWVDGILARKKGLGL